MPNRSYLEQAVRLIVSLLVFMLLLGSVPSLGERIIGGSPGRFVGLAFGFCLAVSAMDLIGPPVYRRTGRGFLVSRPLLGAIFGPLFGYVGIGYSLPPDYSAAWVIAAAVAGAIGTILLEPLRRRRD